MRRLLAAFLLLLLPALSFGQTREVPGDVFKLNTGPCRITSGTFANRPTGANCDRYVQTDGTQTVWLKVGGAWINTGQAFTPAALTKVDDTNVTLTLGGTPATALLQASSLTLGWTGQLSLARGGTAANLTANTGGIFYSGASAAAILAGTATAGQMLRSGATAAPTWSTATWPNTATTAGGYLRADGTNWIMSTLVLPNAATDHRIPWATATNTWGDSANLTFDDSILTVTGSIANSYTSGWAGSGYHLDYNQSYANQSFLELDRLSVRGIMSVYELLIHQIRATNGSFFVANTGKAKTVTDNGGGSYTILTETDHGFAVNDLIRAQRFTGTGTYQSDLTVTGVADTTHFTATLRATYTVPAAGMEYVRLGNTTDANRQGSIYLTADDTNAPYINILSGVAAFTDWGSAAKTVGRIGQQNGAYDYSSSAWGVTFGGYADGTSRISIDPTLGVRLIRRASSTDSTRFQLAADGSGSLATSAITWDTSGNMAISGTVTIGALAASSIAGWAHGSDTTKIDGGDIYTGSIQADKIDVGASTDNLIGNPGAENGSINGWAWVEGTVEGIGASTSASYDGDYVFALSEPATQAAYGYRALPLAPGRKYTVRVAIIGSAAKASGLHIVMQERTSFPGGGWVTVNNRTSTTTFLSNGPVPAGWTVYEYTYTVPSGVHCGTLSIYNWASGAAVYWDMVEFRPQLQNVHIQDGVITAAKLVTDLVISNTIRSSGATALATGTGFWLDATGTPTFRVGNPAGNQIQWDGTNVTLNQGTITINNTNIAIVPATSADAFQWITGASRGYTFDFGAGVYNGLFGAHTSGGVYHAVTLQSNALHDGSSTAAYTTLLAKAANANGSGLITTGFYVKSSPAEGPVAAESSILGSAQEYIFNLGTSETPGSFGLTLSDFGFGSTTYVGIGAAGSGTNNSYRVLWGGTNQDLYFNAGSAAGIIYFKINNVTKATLNADGTQTWAAYGAGVATFDASGNITSVAFDPVATQRALWDLTAEVAGLKTELAQLRGGVR